MFQATRSLLRLQQPSGAWRCTLTAPNDTPLWAIHDALYALRVVRDTSHRNLAPISLSGYLSAERTALQHLTATMLRHQTVGRQADKTSRRWLQTGWMSALSVAVIVLVLVQAGLFRQMESSSLVHKALVTLATAATTTVGAVSPLIIAEEYRIRRKRAIDNKHGGGG